MDANESDGITILEYFRDCQEHGGDEALARYVVHCGIDIDAADDMEDAILAHYRMASGALDIERAATDLATYPPVANRIRELREQKVSGGTDVQG
jgi:hypothetical protein